ncbi:16S rRNA (uracil(1498)-N(3))-methyltransferase [Geobacter pelophilus]|uniref:Ribosomal RNA small subunit methyltransferase E n=1 Tax=Geoanaerobacter pelophilus TaxID=60036 RepID=A0AAW4L3S5_9BACT|nr:16S rRNA (uracil(1498)-N(3))-methyltransferase [Geoanaerobacter pelophilus]MBT0664847.1 16S rRNA (uracil(1498)-N(3))-methyltransferase [Geoanaerobacter pelophilus]
MRRFLVPANLISGESVIIEGDLYRHMAKVLRLQPGNRVALCDGQGMEFTATILQIDNRSLSLQITAQHSTAHRASELPFFTLIQGLPKGDKFELIIQKATELGVHNVIAFPAARSVVKIPQNQIDTRICRWGKIAAEAARQSERTTVPTITLVEDLGAALRNATQPVKLFLYEREQKNHLHETLEGIDPPTSVAILVGPEGGFSEAEISLARTTGFFPVSLGPRILRTETASLAMLSILQFLWGDLR